MLAKPDHPELSIEALTKWLRNQPADKEYVWSDPAFCLMGRYMADHDSSWGAVSYSELPNYELIAATKPWTFGAALERAEKLLALPMPEPDLGPVKITERYAMAHTPEFETAVEEEFKALPPPTPEPNQL